MYLWSIERYDPRMDTWELGTLLFDGKAKEALDKATEAHSGTLQLKDDDVTWKLLGGDMEKEVLKKMIQAQQVSYSRTKGR
ncbi:hypothetical protein CRUP_037666, partial [Coryphaenoides rupestris]